MISFIMLNVQRVKSQKTTLKKRYEGCQKKYNISSKLTKNEILNVKRKNIGKLIYKKTKQEQSKLWSTVLTVKQMTEKEKKEKNRQAKKSQSKS